MALLNLTVNNYELRLSAYNLLVSLANTFSFKINSILLEGYDIAIPNNNKHFINKLSGELAESEASMTIEFLQQAIDGLNKADTLSQTAVLDYMKPWLLNIPNLLFQFRSESDINKIKDLFNSIIALSIREHNEIGPMILSKIWKTLGRIESVELLEYLMECLISRTITSSGVSCLGTKLMDCFEDIIVTLASKNRTFISGKIVFLLINQLRSTKSKNTKKINTRIELSSNWTNIEVALRLLLTLSFENLICVDEYMSELFFIIISLFSCGDSLIRSNVHALFMNLIHSIFNYSICFPDKLQTLRFYFHEFQQLHFRLQFGIGTNKSLFSPYKKSSERSDTEKLGSSFFPFLSLSPPPPLFLSLSLPLSFPPLIPLLPPPSCSSSLFLSIKCFAFPLFPRVATFFFPSLSPPLSAYSPLPYSLFLLLSPISFFIF